MGESKFDYWTWRIGAVFLLVLCLFMIYNSTNQQEECRRLVKSDVFFKVECVNLGKGMWICNDGSFDRIRELQRE